MANFAVLALLSLAVAVSASGSGTIRLRGHRTHAAAATNTATATAADPTQNIVEIASATPQLSTLVSALTRANLVNALEGPGPFTVFAPTNEAFTKLPSTLLGCLIDNPAQLADVLLYHVVSGHIDSKDLQPSQEVATLDQGIKLSVTKNADGVFVNNAQVITADVEATNGVVHIINTVLIPNQWLGCAAPSSNIVQLAQNTPALSTLVKAVVLANLTDALSGPGPFTVFAPTDDAFAQVPADALNCLLNNPSQLAQILAYHVVSGAVTSAELYDQEKITTLEGLSVTVNFKNQKIDINNAAVVIPDVFASNGVVHVIDTVLVPDLWLTCLAPANNIVQVAQATPALSTLVKAVVAANLTAALSGPGPFTVFAPTNDAFAKIPKTVLDCLLADVAQLTEVLTYHVVAGGAVTSAQLTNGEKITTLEGLNVTVTIAGQTVDINNAAVVIPDVLASNGVVHVIDTVLLPNKWLACLAPANNIVQLAQATPALSTLVKAVVAANLTAALSGPGPFTVFAPTNDAFAKISAANLSCLLANVSQLAQVLTYHVVSGATTSAQLTNGEKITTLQGLKVTVTISNQTVDINNAAVVTPDVFASNGVVHVIDTVLVPTWLPCLAPASNIVQTAQATPALSTLVTAVVAANLVSTLSGPGPFTVFAPTNDAFAKISSGALSCLLANISQLTDILTYHVVSGAVTSSQLFNQEKVPTVEGQNVTVSIGQQSVKINNAKVVIADVFAANGVVHVIDTVLVPNKWFSCLAPASNIVQVAQATPSLSTLVSAVVAANLTAALSGPGPFTVFAPGNDAFAKIPTKILNCLLANVTQLTQVLTYHVVSGATTSAQLTNGEQIQTLQGGKVTIRIIDPVITVNNATVVIPDVFASNGVVHVISAVLLPDTKLPCIAQSE